MSKQSKAKRIERTIPVSNDVADYIRARFRSSDQNADEVLRRSLVDFDKWETGDATLRVKLINEWKGWD